MLRCSLSAKLSLGHNDIAAALSSLLEAPLQAENYHQKFELLLHLEEIQMEVDIRRYDMQDVTMVQERGLLVLNVRRGVRDGRGLAQHWHSQGAWHHTGLLAQVPGVAENRPSLLRGDHLFAHLSSERDHSPLTQYKGYVHSVELEKVRLGFSSK